MSKDIEYCFVIQKHHEGKIIEYSGKGNWKNLGEGMWFTSYVNARLAANKVGGYVKKVKLEVVK